MGLEINKFYEKLNKNKISISICIGILFVLFFVTMLYIGSESHNISDYEFSEGVVPFPIDDYPFEDRQKLISHLRFRFLYVMSESDFDRIKSDNMFVLFRFVKYDIPMICIFTKSTFRKEICPKIASRIKRYTYKMYDTYVTGSTRVFNDINRIIMCQGYDRDNFGTDCISTVQMNEICSNKMEYIRYFMKHGLMINTEIKKYDQKKFKHKYVKSPYSSRSACVGYEYIGRDCYLADGVIVQEPNNMLNRFEYKCYTLDGNIYMVILRMEGRNYNKCFMLDELDMNDPLVPAEAKKLFKQYQKEIHDICHTTYLAVNSLVGMRLAKQEMDEKNAQYIIQNIESSGFQLSDQEKLKIKYYLASLVNNEKEKLIEMLNKRYKQNISSKLFTTSIIEQDDLLENRDKLVIRDRFMRVDLSVPDGGKYDRVTVTEIEPYASGIYGYDTIGKCIRPENGNEFININQYNLYRIISSD